MMNSSRLNHEFGYYLHKAAALSDRVGNQLFRRAAGVSMMQYLLLRAIGQNDGVVSQQVLVKELGATKGAISRQITSCRRGGLIRVRRSTDSRRECEVSLTAKGREVFRCGRKLNDELETDRPKYVSDAHLKTTVQTLRKISEVLTAMEKNL